jgi:hypothetical protein
VATSRKRSDAGKVKGRKASRKLALKKETLRDLAPRAHAKAGALITPYRPLAPSKVGQSGTLSFPDQQSV